MEALQGRISLRMRNYIGGKKFLVITETGWEMLHWDQAMRIRTEGISAIFGGEDNGKKHFRVFHGPLHR